jgi:hypothetical protein
LRTAESRPFFGSVPRPARRPEAPPKEERSSMDLLRFRNVRKPVSLAVYGDEREKTRDERINQRRQLLRSYEEGSRVLVPFALEVELELVLLLLDLCRILLARAERTAALLSRLVGLDVHELRHASTVRLDFLLDLAAGLGSEGRVRG